MKEISTRVRASKKIFSIDQSDPNFSTDDFIDLCSSSYYRKNSSAMHYWLHEDEIMEDENYYKKELGDVFADALEDIRRYGSWLGYKVLQIEPI